MVTDIRISINNIFFMKPEEIDKAGKKIGDINPFNDKIFTRMLYICIGLFVIIVGLIWWLLLIIEQHVSEI